VLSSGLHFQENTVLEFEHLVQINDPASAHIPPLSREDLWAGLLLRARYPGQFNPAVSSRLEEIDAAHFVRYLRVGDGELRDEVRLRPLEAISTRMAGEGLQAESITLIEEPQPGWLFVRFIYRRDSANERGGLDVDGYLKSAYLVSDREAIAAIREMVRSGWPLSN
jgi:hypothetical protein